MTLFYPALLVAGTLYGAASDAAPTQVNVVNRHKVWFDAGETVLTGDQGSTAGVLIAKAPSDKALVITDFVMTHNVSTTSSTFRANFRRGPVTNPVDCQSANAVLGPYVNPKETVSINLSTGLLLKPGEQLCLAVGGASTGQGISVNITGYLTSPGTGP
jgi:hypothetical protein